MDSKKSSNDNLQRFIAGLQEGQTESVLADALLQCSRECGITVETELLLFLTSDSSFVQRWMLKFIQERKWHVMCQPAEVQRFLQKVLLALSILHVTQKHEPVSREMIISSSSNSSFASITRSVGNLLSASTTAAATSGGEGMTPASPCLSGSLFFTTGCSSLDHVLHGSNCPVEKGASNGGFRAGFVSEIYGEAGSGKTQLVLQSLLHCVAENLCELWTPSGTAESFPTVPMSLKRVAALYIVSEDFPAARLTALASGALERTRQNTLRAFSHLPPSLMNQLQAYLKGSVTVRSVIAGLHIRRIHTLGELTRMLRDGTLSTAFHALGGRGVVAVDSIAGAAGAADRASTDFACGGGTSDVLMVGALLKTFAVRERAAVLVTNQVRSVLAGAKRQQQHGGRDVVAPALGIQWSVTPHVRIHLRRLQSGGGGNTTYRQLIVLSGPSNPPLCTVYVISADGIKVDS